MTAKTLPTAGILNIPMYEIKKDNSGKLYLETLNKEMEYNISNLKPEDRQLAIDLRGHSFTLKGLVAVSAELLIGAMKAVSTGPILGSAMVTHQGKGYFISPLESGITIGANKFIVATLSAL